jgi:choline dehydrogenase
VQGTSAFGCRERATYRRSQVFQADASALGQLLQAHPEVVRAALLRRYLLGMRYDVVIVGGGSAGCVLAARLSEDASRTVLVVEAGPDHPDPQTLPADVVDASQPTVDHDWGYVADPELDRGIGLPRARIMGGCSATNACFALRGAPQDYDGWLTSGNAGWSFAEVLEDFRRLEDDLDFRDSWHGSDGLIPIQRPARAELNPVQAAFVEGAVGLGHAYVEDHNRPGAVGVGPTPRNVRNGMRMSTAVTYLAEARPRPNLTIRPDTVVADVECSGTRVTGIRLVDGTAIEADRVVLSAGTYASPTILMRSGIGPATELLGLGIEPVVDLPGVGSNLVDHPLVSVDLPTRPASTTSRFQAHLTLHSAGADPTGPPDLLLFAAGPFDVGSDHGASGAACAIVSGLMAPRSRGWVRLSSSAPDDPPRIHPAHLAVSDDLERMCDAVTEARRLAQSEPMTAITTGAELQPGPTRSTDDREALAAWVLSAVSTFHHPVGTCAMGADPSSGAVCDSRGSVHGIEGLTVADASIMPTIPTANTNLPTIMVAEHVASYLRSS